MATVLLGIESSCDETAASVLRDGQIMANCLATQPEHKRYGGVVPELASRAHLANIVPVVSRAMDEAKIDFHDLSAIAYTRGPGLLGSLMVGSSYAQGLALALKLPLIAVHHMQAHVLAHFIDEPKPAFPFICLTVSGGHTQIVQVRDYLDMEILGETIDDAAGEAFDKTARMLGIPYPGGPVVDAYAEQGNPDAFAFAEPRVPGLDFSFSGLKTSVLYFLRDKLAGDAHFIDRHMEDLCASIRKAITGTLMKKLVRAAEITGIGEIAIAGGVAANKGLRRACVETGKALGWNIYIPDLAYCTDNAAMIAMTGYYKFLAGRFDDTDLAPLARMEFIKTVK